MSGLAGRLAVVTGASRGIGLAAAEALVREGVTVVRLARSLKDGARNRFNDVACDLTQASEVVRASTRILGDWGTPHILVNNAGAFLLKAFEVTDPLEFDHQLAANLKAPFFVTQGFLPAMSGAGEGLVITIGSISDHHAYPENAAYAASKYGLRGLHETLAAEYRGRGVRFTLISPGPTDTAIWDPVDPDHRPGFLRRSEMLLPDDVADAVLFAATRPARATVEWIRLMPTPASRAG
jgi:NAD(P)-dependent dehydrogenase (short-subunit alcohol dehydrogenase family)